MAFRGFLKQSTAVTKTVYMVKTSDRSTGQTGLAAGLTKYLSKAGAAPTAQTMTTAELDATNMDGVYSLAFTAAQTDTLGEFALNVIGASADAVQDTWEVVTRLPGEAVLLDGVTHTSAVIPQVTLVTTTTTLTDLTTTANAEPTSVPASNATLAAKIAWLFILAKNKITQSSTVQTVLANDSATTVATGAVSDNGTTFTRDKFA